MFATMKTQKLQSMWLGLWPRVEQRKWILAKKTQSKTESPKKQLDRKSHQKNQEKNKKKNKKHK